MENCIFCSIATHTLDTHEVIWEDESHIAFLDIKPLKAAHTLVIPKKHTDYIHNLTDTEHTALMLASKQVAAKLKSHVECKLIAYIVEGQSVAHVHVHLIPLHEHEKLAEFKTRDVSREELAVLAKTIR